MRMSRHVSHSSIYVKQILAKLGAKANCTSLLMDKRLIAKQIHQFGQILEVEPNYYMRIVEWLPYFIKYFTKHLYHNMMSQINQMAFHSNNTYGTGNYIEPVI